VVASDIGEGMEGEGRAGEGRRHTLLLNIIMRR